MKVLCLKVNRPPNVLVMNLSTLPKFNMKHKNDYFPKGISYSRVPFSGFMFNFGRVWTRFTGPPTNQTSISQKRFFREPIWDYIIMALCSKHTTWKNGALNDQKSIEKQQNNKPHQNGERYLIFLLFWPHNYGYFWERFEVLSFLADAKGGAPVGIY